MSPYLKQAKKGFKFIIDENGFTGTIRRKPLIPDGVGGMVIDPYGTATDFPFYGRVCRNSEGPFDFEMIAAGVDSDKARFLVTQDLVKEGDSFTFEGKVWIIGIVDPIRKFGGILGYQTLLKGGS